MLPPYCVTCFWPAVLRRRQSDFSSNYVGRRGLARAIATGESLSPIACFLLRTMVGQKVLYPTFRWRRWTILWSTA
ncbi:hypothetical protein D3C84_851330 [compost metagenome]